MRFYCRIHPTLKPRQSAPHQASLLISLMRLFTSVSGRGGDALRRQITRRGIPFLAESAPQQGGQYLGPDNKQAGLELGRLAGQDAVDVHELRVLIVGHPELTNTRERAAGFEAGLREAFNGDLKIVSVNGQGSYRVATRVISDAMAAAEQFDVVFAVNDHSAIAAAELAQTNEQSVTIYATGGEAAEFVARVQEDSVIRAVAAFSQRWLGNARWTRWPALYPIKMSTALDPTCRDHSREPARVF